MAEWSIERVADDDADAIEQVRELFAEYHAWLGKVVCSARLAEEIASLPGPYASPGGRLFMARDSEGVPLGCIGVRPHEEGRCEIKRLYVREASRGVGLGRSLIDIAIEASRSIGYREALVSTLPESMPVAAEMYARLGFAECDPFFDHSYVGEGFGIAYFRLVLGEGRQ